MRNRGGVHKKQSVSALTTLLTHDMAACPRTISKQEHINSLNTQLAELLNMNVAEDLTASDSDDDGEAFALALEHPLLTQDRVAFGNGNGAATESTRRE